MLTLVPPGAPSADELAALIAGLRMLEDAHEELAQTRLELAWLVSDAHWRSAAVELLRASLIEQRDLIDAMCAEVVSHLDACLRCIP